MLENNKSYIKKESVFSVVRGDDRGVKFGGVSEELSEVGAEAVEPVLDDIGLAVLLGEALAEHLSEVVGHCCNLEDLLEKGLNHVLRLAHFDLITVCEVVVERLIEKAVVNNVVEGISEGEDLIVPVEIFGTENVKNINDLFLGVRVKALSVNSEVVVLVHSAAISGNQTTAGVCNKSDCFCELVIISILLNYTI